MKLLLVVFVVSFVAYSQALTKEQEEKIKNHHKECSEKSGVDQALLNKARKGEFVNDAKLKAHILCFSKKAGFQNEAGDIMQETLKAKLSPEVKDEEKVKAFIAKCAIKKATPQDTAFDMMKCYYDSTPNHASLI